MRESRSSNKVRYRSLPHGKRFSRPESGSAIQMRRKARIVATVGSRSSPQKNLCKPQCCHSYHSQKRGAYGMGKAYRIMELLADRAELETEPMPAQPIIEVAGDRRLLVENHRGVSAYSTEKILINVGFGTVCVCGCGLRLIRMTKEQLVIRGRIDSISLLRRNER